MNRLTPEREAEILEIIRRHYAMVPAVHAEELWAELERIRAEQRQELRRRCIFWKLALDLYEAADDAEYEEARKQYVAYVDDGIEPQGYDIDYTITECLKLPLQGRAERILPSEVGSDGKCPGCAVHIEHDNPTHVRGCSVLARRAEQRTKFSNREWAAKLHAELIKERDAALESVTAARLTSRLFGIQEGFDIAAPESLKQSEAELQAAEETIEQLKAELERLRAEQRATLILPSEVGPDGKCPGCAKHIEDTNPTHIRGCSVLARRAEERIPPGMTAEKLGNLALLIDLSCDGSDKVVSEIREWAEWVRTHVVDAIREHLKQPKQKEAIPGLPKGMRIKALEYRRVFIDGYNSHGEYVAELEPIAPEGEQAKEPQK